MKTKKDLNRIANKIVKVVIKLKEFDSKNSNNKNNKKEFISLNQQFVNLSYLLQIGIKNADSSCQKNQKWYKIAREYSIIGD